MIEILCSEMRSTNGVYTEDAEIWWLADELPERCLYFPDPPTGMTVMAASPAVGRFRGNNALMIQNRYLDVWCWEELVSLKFSVVSDIACIMLTHDIIRELEKGRMEYTETEEATRVLRYADILMLYIMISLEC